MRVLVTLLLFLGVFLVTHSVYDAKYRELKQEKRIEYRFVPRTYYEDQLGTTDLMGDTFKSMFAAVHKDRSKSQESSDEAGAAKI